MKKRITTITLLLVSTPLLAATLQVTTTLDELAANSDCSLREAVIAANTDNDYLGCTASEAYGDDTIHLPAGTYNLDGFPAAGEEADTATGDLDITAPLTVIGAHKTTIIDGNHSSRIFDVLPGVNVRFRNLIMQHGLAGPEGGGAIRGVSSNITLQHCMLRHNRADRGAGIFSRWTNLELEYSAFHANSADSEGGAIFFAASDNWLNLKHSLLSGNSAGSAGAAIMTNSTGGRHTSALLSVSHSTLVNNGSGETIIHTWDAFMPGPGQSKTQVTLNHTLMANPGSELAASFGTSYTRHYTLLDDASLSDAGSGNKNNASITLDNNFLPLAGSDALNSGDNAAVTTTTDLTGHQRIVGTVDIGAFERPDYSCPGDKAYIDTSATQPGDGKSWATAWRNLHDAMAVVMPCELHVAEGIYYPARALNTSANLDLADGISIIGGYPAGGGTAAERDWQQYPTIISGDLYQDDIHTDGITENATDIRGNNSIGLLRAFDNFALDGLILTAGDRGSTQNGGAIFTVGNANLTLKRMRFSGNTAQDGGAIFIHSPTLDMQQVVFNGNRAYQDGGAIAALQSALTIDAAQFSDNTATRGSAIAFKGRKETQLSNLAMWHNQASSEGTLWADAAAEPASSLVNSSIVSNDNGGFIAPFAEERWRISNSLIWNNGSRNIHTSESTVSHSLIEGCYTAGVWNDRCGQDYGDNLNATDPLLADIANGDFRPTALSPLIGTGDNVPVTGTKDLSGKTRIVGPAVDIGAYEHPGFSVTALAGANGAITPASIQVQPQQVLNFTVTPDAHYQIDTINGCSGTLSGNTYTTGAITAACQVDVTFAPILFDVTASHNTGGSVTPLAQNVQEGSTGQLLLTPDANYQIASVTGCGGTLSGNTYTTGAITAACQVDVTFAPILFDVTASHNTGGSVTPLAQQVQQGSNTQLTIAPSAHYQLVSATGCNGTLTGNTYTTGPVNSNCHIDVQFAPIMFEVLTAASNGGSLTPTQQQLASGTSATLTVSPNEHYQLDSISGCNGQLTGNLYTTAALSDDCTVSASFSRRSYVITTTVGAGGSVTPSRSTLIAGDSTTLTVTANAFFDIAAASGCGGTLAGNQYHIAALSGDCSVDVQFERQFFNITVDASSGGKVTPVSGLVAGGETLEVVLTPDQHHRITSATGCGGQLQNQRYVIPIITADCHIQVRFRADENTLSSGAGAINLWWLSIAILLLRLRREPV